MRKNIRPWGVTAMCFKVPPIRTIKVHLPVLLLLFPASSALSQEVPYTTGNWEAGTFGNHRVVVSVAEEGEAVWAHIEWRRRDLEPERKNVIIVDARTGERVTNFVRVEVNREFGDLVFQPRTAPGQYYIYYLPYESTGGSYPRVTYPEPEETADAAWLQRNDLTPGSLERGGWRDLPQVEVFEFQAIDDFHSFWPMEVIATGAEVADLRARYSDLPFLLFLEDRSRPIRMNADLPLSWIESGPGSPVRGEAMRGEYYSFQLGVYAMQRDLENVRVRFNPLVNRDSGESVHASEFSCFNLGGINWTGERFGKRVDVPEGKVQALWCGVQVPGDIGPGTYTTLVHVGPEGTPEQSVALRLEVSSEVIEAAGDNEPERLSRLRWLDSRIALDDELVTPYTPMEMDRTTISVLGRQVEIGPYGLPVRITSTFAPEMTHLMERQREILSAPLDLQVEDDAGRRMEWRSQGVYILEQEPGIVVWGSTGSAGILAIDVHAEMEFDGNIEFEVVLKAVEVTPVNDIRLLIPVARDVAKYMMGLGFKGGLRPGDYSWQWDVEKNQDGAWIGDVNAGLQFSLRDENYRRPLNTNFYQLKPLVMPVSWSNGGQGGIRLEEEGDSFLMTCYSGPRTIEAGEELHFNFRLAITPFRPIDTGKQFGTRFYHRFSPIDEVIEMGANTINVHHATEINPYINYPFMRPDEMKEYIDEAHEKGLKVKIYYTVRELANRAPELFTLFSLGDEIFAPGPGGGYSWLQEHLNADYIGGWFVPRYEDAAVVTSGVSRWHNYYLEGLDWLVRNVGIDGLYIDDVAFDRTVMKRVRKILDRGNPGALIDLHSANQYNPRDGFANSANLYLEHFPFIDRLWFGEYFDYDSAPDFWLTEVSGIPFGLMGEMLQGGGNPWRGMIYGMTNRQPYGGNDPSPIWKVWDEFGIEESRMIGYWVPGSPITTDRDDVLVTSYLADGRALVSIASWAEENVEVRLNVDWTALGIEPGGAVLTAPEIEGFQEGAVFGPGDGIPVEPGRGWLIVIKEK